MKSLHLNGFFINKQGIISTEVKKFGLSLTPEPKPDITEEERDPVVKPCNKASAYTIFNQQNMRKYKLDLGVSNIEAL